MLLRSPVVSPFSGVVVATVRSRQLRHAEKFVKGWKVVLILIFLPETVGVAISFSPEVCCEL
jgi:hypothetical protein